MNFLAAMNPRPYMMGLLPLKTIDVDQQHNHRQQYLNRIISELSIYLFIYMITPILTPNSQIDLIKS